MTPVDGFLFRFQTRPPGACLRVVRCRPTLPLNHVSVSGRNWRPSHRRSPGQGHWLARSEEHTSELQSPCNLLCRLLLDKKKKLLNRDDSTSAQQVSTLVVRRATIS